MAARLLDLLPASVAPGGLVLEVGTGTGEVARRLLAASPDITLVVSDLAHGMTAHTAASLGGVLAADADAESLPFRTGRFDQVLSASVFQWVNDLPAALAEVARVLRPGGIFALAMYGDRTLWELREAHCLALRETGRITSYNVCYTKLLRCTGVRGPCDRTRQRNRSNTRA